MVISESLGEVPGSGMPSSGYSMIETTTVAFTLTYAAMPEPAGLRAALGELNWTALALGVMVVFLDLGFFMLYRGGFDVSLAQLITQSAGALILLVVGVAFFAEKLSLVNLGGIALCIAGLWLINKR